MEKLFRPRMSGWLAVVVLLLIAVWLIAPHQVPVSLYKLSLVTLAAVVGYWLDRSLFPYARPHELFGSIDGTDLAKKVYEAYCKKAGGKTFDNKPLPSFAELGAERQACWHEGATECWKAAVLAEHPGMHFAAALLRRAIIVAAAMIAVSLGA
jgi:hypothetical protein